MRSKRELSQIIFMFLVFLVLVFFKLTLPGNAAWLEPATPAQSAVSLQPQNQDN